MSRRRRRSRRHRSRLQRRHVLLGSAGLLAILVLGWLAYLDFTVQSRFSGALWRLPAVVYARPLELHVGLRLDADEFDRHLAQIGFTPVDSMPARPGAYRRSGNRFDVFNRPFRFWDENQSERLLTVRFRAGEVAAMQDPRGAAVALARMEPVRIGQLYAGAFSDRRLLKLEEIPEPLLQALIVMEDRQFFEHIGVRPTAILRALVANIRAGRTVQGGSTLTQQLVKNLFLSPERSLWRKVNEALMALMLEFHFDKRQILEAYCNEVFLGQVGQRSVHGFATASRFYFNRPLAELRLSQYALLAGLVKGPSYLDPRRYPERARARRDLVLRELAGAGLIDAETLAAALLEPLGVVALERVGLVSFPAYMDLVRLHLQQDYRREQIEREGLRIFTHLDLDWQQRMERSIDDRLAALERHAGMPGDSLQTAGLLVERETGRVLAVSGGRDHRLFGYNRALNARRPIGSLVKPAVYLAALSRPQRYSLVSPVLDEPFVLEQRGAEPWQPDNFDGQAHGTVPLGEALVHSYNLATARLGLELGVESVVSVLRALGVQRELPTHPSVLLGAIELSPLEVAQVYQGLAAGGFPARLQTVEAVISAAGEPLQRYPLEVSRGVDPRAAYLLNTLLERVTVEGTAAALRERLPGRRLAGKTGTSDDLRDSWFAGFDPRWLAVFWIGRDNNEPTGFSGSRGALPLWADLMEGSQARGELLTEPGGVTWAWVDPATGRASAEHCEQAVRMPFIEGSVPTETTECGGRGPRGAGEWIRSWFR